MRLLKMEEKKILKEYENIFIQKQIRSPEHNISDMKAEVFKLLKIKYALIVVIVSIDKLLVGFKTKKAECWKISKAKRLWAYCYLWNEPFRYEFAGRVEGRRGKNRLCD